VTKSALFTLLVCAVLAAAFLLFPWPLQQKLFAVAYGLDPQRPTHSYFIAGMQIPLEARKLGMFGGFLLTYLYLLALRRGRAANFPPASVSALLLGFIATMGLDGLNATLFDLGLPNAYAPVLALRLATGLLAGIAMAGLLLPAFNGTMWHDVSPLPSLRNMGEAAGALALAVCFFAIVDARPAILYYPVAILGITGLVTELTLINSIIAMVLGRRVGMARTLQDALPAFAAGLILTTCELAVMSAVHYVMLGDMAGLM